MKTDMFIEVLFLKYSLFGQVHASIAQLYWSSLSAKWELVVGLYNFIKLIHFVEIFFTNKHNL